MGGEKANAVTTCQKQKSGASRLSGGKEEVNKAAHGGDKETRSD